MRGHLSSLMVRALLISLPHNGKRLASGCSRSRIGQLLGRVHRRERQRPGSGDFTVPLLNTKINLFINFRFNSI